MEKKSLMMEKTTRQTKSQRSNPQIALKVSLVHLTKNMTICWRSSAFRVGTGGWQRNHGATRARQGFFSRSVR